MILEEAHAPTDVRKSRSDERHVELRFGAVEPEATHLVSAPVAPAARASRFGLKAALIAADALAFAIAWLTSSVIWRAGMVGFTAGLAAAVSGVLLMWAHGLYRSRVSGSREVELSRTFRSAALSAVVFSVVMNTRIGSGQITIAVFGGIVAFLGVSLFRGIYAATLRERRARGLNIREVLLVGAGEESREVSRLIGIHPEHGFRVAGVIGARADYRWSDGSFPLLGDTSHAVELAVASGVNSVVLCLTDLGAAERNDLAQQFRNAGFHVHLSIGLLGIDPARLSPTAIAHELLYYVEPESRSRVRLGVKRAIDLCVGLPMLFLTAPLMLAVAIAIKLDDRGPVFFRQVRVGRNGKPITILKMRTMVPNAESLLVDLRDQNQRDNALFKMKNDPRRTRVGRIIEAASIDELPQLFSVLRGTMSLVGPRPALPGEVANFDSQLLSRLEMPPGLTGLWQIEARDNPSFDAYRRLDLFYVKNWSLSMDAAIIFETITSVFSRVLLRGSKSTGEVESAAEQSTSSSSSSASVSASSAPSTSSGSVAVAS